MAETAKVDSRSSEADQGKNHTYLGLILTCVIIIAAIILAWRSLDQISRQHKEELVDNLTAVLQTTSGAYNEWASEKLIDLSLMAKRKDVQALVIRQLAVPQEAEAIKNSRALAGLRDLLGPVLELHGYEGFFVIAPNYLSIASSRDENIGTENLIVGHGDYLERIFNGESQLILPLISDVSLRNDHGLVVKDPTMFIGVPVFGDDGSVIAALTIRLNPMKGFSSIARNARTRRSGESYLFDAQGRMLTQSRFHEDLHRIGLLSEEYCEVLHLRILDPGGNMMQGYRPEADREKLPLTKMAIRAIAGEDGVDLDGYRDYRGVRVVGAWLWNDRYKFGIAYEQDWDEAYGEYKTTREIILWLTTLIVIMFVGLAGILVRRQVSVARANRRLSEEIVERVRSEQELRDSEERIKVLLNSTAEAIYGLNIEGDCTFCNPSCVKMLGYESEDDLLGRNMHDLIHHTRLDGSEYPEHECRIYKAFREGNGTHVYDEVLWRKDGSSFAAEYWSYPIRIGGELVGSVVTFIDITRRLEAQEEYRHIVDSAHDAFWAVGEGGVFVDINEAACRMLGYSREEMLGLRFQEIEATETPEETAEHTRKVMEEGGDIFESVHRRKDGTLIDVEVSASFFPNKRGEFRIYAFVRDITGRKDAQNSLKESEQKYRSVMSTSPIGITIYNENGQCIDANEAIAGIIGATMEQVLSQNFHEIKSWKESGLYEKALLAIKEETSQSFAVMLTTTFGRPVFLDCYMVPFGSGGLLFMAHDITARREAEEAFRKSSHSLAEAQRIAQLGSWEWDIKNNKLFWSDEIYRIFGLEPQEFAATYEAFLNSVHPDDRDLVAGAVTRALEEKSFYEIEHRVVRHDSTERIVRERAELHLDEQGEPDSMIGSVQDITEHKLIEQELKKRGEHLALAQEVARIGSWEWDLATNDLIWSGEVYRLFGLEESRKPDFNSFVEAIYSDDKEAVNEAIQNALKKDEPYDVKYRIVRTDGQVRNVQAKGSALRDESGKPTGMIGMIYDITAQVRAEQRMRLSAKFLDETSEGILITDAEGNIQDVNTAFERMSGFSREDVLGKNPRVLKSGRHDNEFYKEMWDSIVGEGQWQGEIWDRRSNGEIYPKWMSIVAVKDEGGIITNYVALSTEITKLKETEEQLHNLAHYDQLTGLPNRLLLHDRIEQSIVLSKRHGHTLAVLMLDLDEFKNVNDSMGHLVGDRMLVEVAGRLREIVRESDTISRQGGDEFVILLRNIHGAEDAAYMAQKVIDKISEPYILESHDVRVTASVGITFCPDDSDNMYTLLKNADTAMYHAKKLGKNSFQFFTEELNTKILEKIVLESRLRKAVENKGFHINYQPRVDLATGKMHGMEALARWDHHEYGNVSPAKFIPAAEDTGLILPLGEFVLQSACQQLKGWLDKGCRPLKVSVNLSARQFRKSDLHELVRRVLDDTGLKAEFLELEITESVVMTSVDDSIEIMKKLKAMGVAISVDDFGTGYSSLSYLKRFPIDALKIDRSFIIDVTTDPDARAVVDAIMALARSLKLKVVAEGVETREQLEFLREKGCDEVQGYYFSRPVHSDEFCKMIDKDIWE